MESENLNMDDITEARRQAIRESLESIDTQQLQKLAEVMFPYPDHPWMEKISTFIADNRFGTFHYAKTRDGLQVIYSYDQEKGMWCIPDHGVGLLSPRSLKIMKEIVGGG